MNAVPPEVCHGAGALDFAVLQSCDLSPEDIAGHYRRWLELGNGGAVEYIDQRLDTIGNPFEARPWAKSVLVVTFAEADLENSPLRNLPGAVPGRPCGKIAGYALKEDYHLTGRRILENIASALNLRQCEICVDASPVPEKYLALAAGLGLPAPNSLVRIPDHGCRLHLAELFTDAELPTLRHTPQVQMPCGDCMRCRTLCPNHAMTADGMLIVRQCRSWLAGQYRGALTWKQQLAMGGCLFGCSICSSCCPENEVQDDFAVDAEAVLAMPGKQLQRIIAKTPLAHSGVTLLKRNCAAALGTQLPSKQRGELASRLLNTIGSTVVLETVKNWE